MSLCILFLPLPTSPDPLTSLVRLLPPLSWSHFDGLAGQRPPWNLPTFFRRRLHPIFLPPPPLPVVYLVSAASHAGGFGRLRRPTMSTASPPRLGGRPELLVARSDLSSLS